jgi:protein N-terminal methyltransferase
MDSKFDVIWCQWCLGHLSDPDFVKFLQRAREALRDPASGLIIVKENCCSEPDGVARTVFDEEDSSLTR